jgi:hypothetical protein
MNMNNQSSNAETMTNAIEQIQRCFGKTIAYKTGGEVRFGFLSGMEVSALSNPETGDECTIWLRISIRGFGPTENNFISIHSSELVNSNNPA